MSAMLQRLVRVNEFITSGRFGRVLGQLSVISASRGSVTCQMKVAEDHLNSGGALHGGVTATLVDHVSSLAIMANDAPPGISVDLNTSYLRAACLGDVLTIKSECQKVGKTLAFATVDITDQNGKLIALGRHTKFVA